MIHIPVLKNQVLKYLNIQPNQNFIDCTINGGGHASAILEKNKPEGKLLGIEIDTKLCRKLKKQMAEIRNPKSEIRNRLIIINDSFVHLKNIVKKQEFKNVSGILFDLGMSTWHLKQSNRGFSFQKNELLDMRYNPNSQDLTAAQIINTWPLNEIEKILKEYGEEKFSKRIAEKIIEQRKIKPITTTFQLVEVIKSIVPKNYIRARIHPATRTFQALRITVNDELNNLKKTLSQALEVLAPGGRLVIICFHSLEDRIIKNFFKKEKENKKLKILTKKPIRASQKEISQNPSSSSAKLRASIKA